MKFEGINDILSDLWLPEFSSKNFQYTGLDSIEHCFDKDLFVSWPHSIDYQYNSRGFRDAEWPSSVTELSCALWCIGDSFTVGLGSCLAHTWPQVLAESSQQRTINVSMDGASNNWIARRCCDIYTEIEPRNMVIMWSYIHRRELNNGLSDLERRAHSVHSTVEQDYENFAQCRSLVRQHCKNTNIVELIIPNWQPVLTQSSWEKIRGFSWAKNLLDLNKKDHHIVSELNDLHRVDTSLLFKQLDYDKQLLNDPELIQVPQLDRARDGHHFDIVTARWVIEKVLPKLV